MSLSWHLRPGSRSRDWHVARATTQDGQSAAAPIGGRESNGENEGRLGHTSKRFSTIVVCACICASVLGMQCPEITLRRAAVQQHIAHLPWKCALRRRLPRRASALRTAVRKPRCSAMTDLACSWPPRRPGQAPKHSCLLLSGLLGHATASLKCRADATSLAPSRATPPIRALYVCPRSCSRQSGWKY